VINFFTKKEKTTSVYPIEIDIHSHLLPGLDDGVDTLSHSLNIISRFISLGYKKIITTPHIMAGIYNNTPAIILSKLDELKEAVKQNNLNIEIEASAEYFLDDNFLRLLDENKNLLPFGENYLLIETGFLSEPIFLKEAIFQICSLGYKPVIAHPERYLYIQNNFKVAEDLYERGVYFQLNLNSLCGHYSKAAKTVAKKLIEQKMITFAGTDCHHINHVEVLHNSINDKLFKKLLDLDLKNNSL
jgi:protein-tyrosine phosphatase